MRFFRNIVLLTLHFYCSGMLYSQEVSFSKTKLNVFIRGIDNPIKVVVENHECEDVRVSSDKGDIISTEDDCRYIVRMDKSSGYEMSLFVGIKEENGILWLDTIKHRVKRIPDPLVYVAGRTGSSSIEKSELLKAKELNTEFHCYDYDMSVEVISYKFETKSSAMDIYTKDVTGNSITKEVIDMIRTIPVGQKVHFWDIKARMPDNTIRELPPISLTLKE